MITAWKNHFTGENNASLIIGEGADIGEYTHITAMGHMRIGKNLLRAFLKIHKILCIKQ